MRPDPGKVLEGAAMAMLADLTPQVRTPFGQNVAGMAGTLNIILAQEFDRLVDRLARENEAIAAIFVDAAERVPPELATRLRDAIDTREPADLRVSTLQAINDRLRGLLIEVHIAVENDPRPEAAALNARIWTELKESTLRRQVVLPIR
jgi:hypothetical protein